MWQTSIINKKQLQILYKLKICFRGDSFKRGGSWRGGFMKIKFYLQLIKYYTLFCFVFQGREPFSQWSVRWTFVRTVIELVNTTLTLWMTSLARYSWTTSKGDQWHSCCNNSQSIAKLYIIIANNAEESFNFLGDNSCALYRVTGLE